MEQSQILELNNNINLELIHLRSSTNEIWLAFSRLRISIFSSLKCRSEKFLLLKISQNLVKRA